MAGPYPALCCVRALSLPPSPPLPSAFIISLAVYRPLRSNGWKLFLREISLQPDCIIQRMDWNSSNQSALSIDHIMIISWTDRGAQCTVYLWTNMRQSELPKCNSYFIGAGSHNPAYRNNKSRHEWWPSLSVFMAYVFMKRSLEGKLKFLAEPTTRAAWVALLEETVTRLIHFILFADSLKRRYSSS